MTLMKIRPLYAATVASLALVSLSVSVATSAHAQKPSGGGSKMSGGDTKKPAGPSQASIASKTSFGTTTTAAAKSALRATDLAGAAKMVGKSGAFQGTVSAVFAPKSNNLVILNFASDYKTALTAVVKKDVFGKFPDLKTLKGKHVLVSGTFSAFKDATEIDLTSPSQIKLVK